MAPHRVGGQSMCMPLVVLCMGGEMIYILEQRLAAQNIALDKSAKGV